MTKSEDDTANDVDDATTEARVEPVTEVANAPKTGRHGWRRRSAAPRNVPEVESSRLSIKMRGRSLGHHQSFEKEERLRNG